MSSSPGRILNYLNANTNVHKELDHSALKGSDDLTQLNKIHLNAEVESRRRKRTQKGGSRNFNLTVCDYRLSENGLKRRVS